VRAKTSRSRVVLLTVAAGLPALLVLLLALPKGPRTPPEWRSFALRERFDSASRIALERPLGKPTNESEWRISTTSHTALGRHVSYTQTIHGRPVLGSFALEHRLRDGTFFLEGREMVCDTARIHERARAAAAIRRSRGKARIVEAYAPSPAGLRAVAEVLLPAEDPWGDWRVVLDLETEEVLSVEDVMVSATGRVFSEPPALPCEGPMVPADDALAEFLETVPLDHLENTGYLDGAYARVLSTLSPRAYEPGLSFLYSPSQVGFEQVVCYHTITSYFAHLEALGVDAFAGRSVVADARGYAGDNSFFSPATARITMGIGGIPDAQDPEIVLHELGHWLHFRAQPEYYLTLQSRAVSEGIADYLACSYYGDPYLAEWDARGHASGCPAYVRRLDEMLTVPADLTGAPHADGLILASALWDARASLGPRLTDRAVLESLFFLRPDSDLLHASAMFLEALRLLDGGGDVETARATFEARGLLAEAASSPEVPALRLTLSPNPSRGPVTVQFTNPASSRVRITVVDVQGRRVRSLLDDERPFGVDSVRWDGRTDGGQEAAAGIYFIDVRTATHAARGKVVLQRGP